MKQSEIKKLIRNLENNKDVNGLDIYQCKERENYFYYYSIIGFLKDDYFAIYFMKFRKSGNIEEYISNSSDNAIQIREYFNLDIPIV